MNHAQYFVIKNKVLHVQPIGVQNRQFLVGHLEAAVSDKADNRFVRIGHLSADRCRNAEAHRSQAAACQQLLAVLERVILSRPHLVLANVRYDNGFTIRQFADILDYMLRFDERIGFFVTERVLLFVVHNVIEPNRVIRHFCQLRVIQHQQRQFGIRQYWDISVHDLADFGIIDVNMDNDSLRGKIGWIACDTVIETCAEVEKQVALHQSHI